MRSDTPDVLDTIAQAFHYLNAYDLAQQALDGLTAAGYVVVDADLLAALAVDHTVGMEGDVTTLPWDQWLDEERARQQPASRTVRPSLELPVDLIARVDRIASVQGVSRHELVTLILTGWLASWRPMPR